MKKCIENTACEEDELDHEVSSSVTEAPAHCIMIPEVIAAQKKMKKHEALGCQG